MENVTSLIDTRTEQMGKRPTFYLYLIRSYTDISTSLPEHSYYYRLHVYYFPGTVFFRCDSQKL